jgi:branched-chain amino acid transport system ATP-binding protein
VKARFPVTFPHRVVVRFPPKWDTQRPIECETAFPLPPRAAATVRLRGMTTAVATHGLLARGLAVGYGDLPVMSGLDLEVAPGEIVALLGRNGVGKTTTLLTLAGAIPALTGEVWLHGEPASGVLHRRARSGVGLLTEERCVFMELTGHENLKLGRGSAERAIELFPELEPHLGKRVGLLSGGQQQMLALARVVAARPRVLLADELSMGLAPLVVRRLLTALRAAANEGAAVLMVEQHVRVALESVDRAYVLGNGGILLSGTAAQLRERSDDIARLYLEGV